MTNENASLFHDAPFRWGMFLITHLATSLPMTEERQDLGMTACISDRITSARDSAVSGKVSLRRLTRQTAVGIVTSGLSQEQFLVVIKICNLFDRVRSSHRSVSAKPQRNSLPFLLIPVHPDFYVTLKLPAICSGAGTSVFLRNYD